MVWRKGTIGNKAFFICIGVETALTAYNSWEYRVSDRLEYIGTFFALYIYE